MCIAAKQVSVRRICISSSREKVDRVHRFWLGQNAALDFVESVQELFIVSDRVGQVALPEGQAYIIQLLLEEALKDWTILRKSLREHAEEAVEPRTLSPWLKLRIGAQEVVDFYE